MARTREESYAIWKAWCEANREKVAAYHKAWRERNRANVRARHKRWEQRHPEKVRARNTLWRRRHPAQMRAAVVAWSQEHPEAMKAIARRRRASQAQAPVNDFTATEWEAMKAYYNNCCAYCGDACESLTQDHVIPLSKGGSHTYTNIVPACLSCNCAKGTKSGEAGAETLLLRTLERIEALYAMEGTSYAYDGLHKSDL